MGEVFTDNKEVLSGRQIGKNIVIVVPYENKVKKLFLLRDGGMDKRKIRVLLCERKCLLITW